MQFHNKVWKMLVPFSAYMQVWKRRWGRKLLTAPEMFTNEPFLANLFIHLGVRQIPRCAEPLLLLLASSESRILCTSEISLSFFMQ